MPESGTTSSVKSHKKESIYYGDDDDEWNYGMDFNDEAYYEDDPDEHYVYDGNDGTYYEEDEDAEQVYAADEAAAEYDEVYAAYVEARSKMNQMRLPRGFYPVVALANWPNTDRIHPRATRERDQAKSLKGKGKTSSKQAPRTPNPQARGKQLWEL